MRVLGMTLLFFALLLSVAPVMAGEDETGGASGAGFNVSSMPVPRFASLAADEVNVRTGPNLRYPIKWILTKEGLPVEIVREFDTWREIRDIEGGTGWVHKSLLSGKRTVVVQGHMRTIYKKASVDSRPVAKLEPGVVADIDLCEETWCRLKAAGYKGWLRREHVWGVYPDEEID